jgi:hypothetical protein
MFAGLTVADFEAYAPKKWKSNVFNRERLEVKQRLLVLGKALQPGLLSADGSPLALDASVEHPALWNHKQVEAQHLFLSRNEGARRELDAILDKQKTLASLIDDPTPQRNHVFLAITLTHTALEVAVKLHPDARIDRQNLERKCEDHFEREKLIGLVSALPDGFQIGTLGSPSTAVAALDADRLRALLAELGRAALSPAVLSVGLAVGRDEVLALGADLTALVHGHLLRLAAIYQFIAWSRDNDFLAMRETLQKEKQVKRQKGLAKNDTVRVVRGMFAGKSGVVQEVDAKGGAKVLLGKVAVKLDAEDLAKA